MELNIRTGFYKFKTFSVNYEEKDIVFICDTERIAVPYDELTEIAVNEGKNKTALEIITRNKNIDTVFDTVSEAELFIKELQAKTNMLLNLNVSFKNERRTIL